MSRPGKDRPLKPIVYLLSDFAFPIFIVFISAAFSAIGYIYFEVYPLDMNSFPSYMKKHCFLNFDPESNILNDISYNLLKQTLIYLLPTTIILSCLVAITLGQLTRRHNWLVTCQNLLLGLVFVVLQTPSSLSHFVHVSYVWILLFNVFAHFNFVVQPLFIYYFNTIADQS